MDNMPPPVAPPTRWHLSQKHIWTALVVLVLLVGAASAAVLRDRFFNSANGNPKDLSFPAFAADDVSVPFEQTSITLVPAISQNFSLSDIQNIDDIEKAYGVTFSQSDLDQLQQNKFVIKNLLDTKISWDKTSQQNELLVSENQREFVELYRQIVGSYDYKERTPANSLFITSDVLMNLFSILSVDLMKETENKYLSPQVANATQQLYNSAVQHVQDAKSDQERQDWIKVRNYFAVPYALVSTTIKPLTAEDYWNTQREGGPDVATVQADYQTKDETADSYDNAAKFVKSLKLDADSQTKVLADLKTVYGASESTLPQIFQQEYTNIPGDIKFTVPFSIFKVRGTYTNSSLRRQYFRAVQWYQQIPFFLSSKELTRYALDIGQLMDEKPDLLKQYDSTLSLLGALVGKSDDLDVSDYAQAVTDLGAKASDTQALNTYLDKRKPQSKIKSMPAFYPTVGEVSLSDVMQATRGMRFFSQKFTPDSYWTGQLTQGDEQPAVNGMKLPGQTSSLEVMTLLGSAYAQNQLPKLPFYTGYKQAIDTRLANLKTEAAGWGDSYWQGNQYTGILWSISGLFNWLQKNKMALPQFMQSPTWDAKTLLTGSAFWTELRHTNILYAKQSFAEKGGGGDGECDIRPIPPPAKGYVEPQPEAYDRLYYTSRLLLAEYKARGLDLSNLSKLENYINLLNVVREYTQLELANTSFTENTATKTYKFYDGTDCTTNFISPDSAVKQRPTDKNVYGTYYPDGQKVDDAVAIDRWEELRTRLVSLLSSSLPTPVEGPILPIKDKRAAVVADVHTSKEGILEEATGVPRVIFVAVKDANGPRLTVGFTYSQYEFLSPSDRLTDEQWQGKLYKDADDDYTILYQPKSTWPTIPAWYQPLLGTQ